MPHQRLDGVRGVLWKIFILQGYFVENLHIIGLYSKPFFFIRDIDILTHKKIRVHVNLGDILEVTATLILKLLGF